MPSTNPAAPEFWSLTTDHQNRQHLRFAIRSGAGRWTLLVLGTALVLGAAGFAHWLTQGDGALTVAGWILLGIVSGGALFAGVYCLGRTLWARVDYLLGETQLSIHTLSVFSTSHSEIRRAAITRIEQTYTPPGKSDPTGSDGRWVTFLYWNADDGKQRELAFDGMRTREECRWLSSLLTQWTGVPIQRAFAGDLEEADPNELPTEPGIKQR